ncbi:MAG: hypothetical protein ABIM89_05835 [Mycobacteriales bacterium]
MRRTISAALSALALSAVALGAGVAPAQAAAESSPVQICRDLAANAPDLYEFIATKPGGCVSTVASVGLEALAAGAFPSNAAAIGNCKFLEQMSFFRFPAPASVYPVVFHEEFGDLDAVIALLIEDGVPAEVAATLAPIVVTNFTENIDAFTANNRAGCVRVLRGLHSGALFELIFAGLG